MRDGWGVTKLAVLMAALWACGAAVQEGRQPAPGAIAAPAAEPQAGQRMNEPVVDLQTVVVTGLQPGPGLWRVSRGDHVLWILGTVTPLPRDIEWDTNAVEKAVARSQQVILAPSVEVKADTGFFGKLALIPSALRARRNPDGRTLQQILAPAEYARWQSLKTRYIGRGAGIEQWRPVFAALQLYDKAIRKSGMRHGGFVSPVVEKLAKRYRVATIDPQLVVTVAQPKQVLKEFAETSLDDTECLVLTLDRIEGDLGRMAERANAWSIGDIDGLRDLPDGNQFTACSAAFTGAALARRLGIDDIPQQLRAKWIAAAERALASNRSTLAILPMSQLLRDDGYLADLRARGYEVASPLD